MNGKNDCEVDLDNQKLSMDRSNLAEPDVPEANMIMSLDNEYRCFREDSKTNDALKPLDLYLMNCKRFTQHNMAKQVITVNGYKFKRIDEIDRVLDPKIVEDTGFLDKKQMEKYRRNNNNTKPNKIPEKIFSPKTTMKNEPVKELTQEQQEIELQNKPFHVLSTRIFTEIIFYQGRQILVVKSWQQIIFTSYERLNDDSVQFAKARKLKQKNKENKDKANKKDGKDVQDNLSLKQESVLEELPPGFDKESNTFFIKTIEFFDDKGESLSQPILVEQIYGEFIENRIYDVSITQYNDKVYFFRRQYGDSYDDQEMSQEDGFTENSLVRVDKSVADEGQNVLQLYSFSLRTNDLNFVKGAYIMEQSLALDCNNINSLIQLNSIFSKQFGQNYNEQKFDSEEAFLQNQYICLQEYIRDTEVCQFKIVQLRMSQQKNSDSTYKIVTKSKYLQPHEDNYPLTEGDKEEFKVDNNQNKSVQILNHILNYKDNSDEIYFIASNYFAIVEIKYDIKKKDYEQSIPKMYKRNSMDIFQKIWNTNGLHIQCKILKKQNVHGHLENIEQYFFIDSRNKVQILFPNYEYKIEKTIITDMIYDQIKISDMNFKEYKKINIIRQNKDSEENQNIIQSISDLQQILDYDKLDQQQQLTFCEDSKTQKLYMSCPKLNTIETWCLKNYYEECTSEVINTEKREANTIMDKVQCTLGKVIVNLNDKFRIMNKDEQKIEKTFCHICDEDHREEYVSARYNVKKFQLLKSSEGEMIKDIIKAQKLGFDDKDNTVRISDKEKDNHILLDNGFLKQKVMSYRRDSKISELTQMRLIMHQPTENHYCFVFAIINQDNNEYDEQSPYNEQRSLLKKSYFFITKTKEEMAEIFESNKCPEERRKEHEYQKVKKRERKYEEWKINYLKEIKEQKKGKQVEESEQEIWRQFEEWEKIEKQKKQFFRSTQMKKQKEQLERSQRSSNGLQDYHGRRSIFSTVTEDDFEEFKEIEPIPIVRDDDNIFLLKSYKQMTQVKFREVREFQFKQIENISHESAKPSQVSWQEDFYTDIKLNFIQVKDVESNINFIPFIYQDKGLENNNLLVFDIIQCKLSQHVCINPAEQSLDYLYVDEQGFNCFSICKTSHVDTEILPENLSEEQKKKIPKQTARYQIFVLFSEKVGFIQCDEFYISHDNKGSYVQTIGKKQIILSKKTQQMYDWNQLKNFKTIPYIDSCGIPKGCSLIFQNQGVLTSINLFDQDHNNLYNYQSQIVLVGQKMFRLNQDDQELYAMVVSTLLRKNIIVRDIFDRYEIEKLLSKGIQITLGMRIPDLKFLMLNTFDDMSKQSFFQAQELLHCKSICDITLGDSETIEEAIQNCNDIEECNLNGSIFDLLIRGDQVRKNILGKIGLAPKISIIQKDLNFTSTIERALRYKNFKSAIMILQHTLEVLNTKDYQHLIMNDLPVLLASKQVTINEFFQISESNIKERVQQGFCNFEIALKNPELPMFSDKPAEYMTAVDEDIEDFHNFEGELAQKIVKRDLDKLQSQKNFIVTHTYVDFRDVVIGEKLRAAQKLKKSQKLRFDDLYYADWMQKCGDSNLKFYLQESVQKLIDFQWTSTRMIQRNLFTMYVILFLIPISFTLFSEQEYVHEFMLQIAILPALVLFFIEVIQMREQGIRYFMGWNIIDFMLFTSFLTLQYYKFIGKDDTMTYMPETKLILIILAFMKLLFFVRIFEDYGFLVQMILLCVLDLIPFIVSYVIFLFIFTICFVVLKMEIDPEVADAEGMSYNQKMFLQVFRTAIGELGMPVYTEILAKDDKLFMGINITLIWLCWFFQTFFMLIIMLNFLIAVITSTYERVMNYQKIISYMHKAELNYETFALKSFFGELPQYKFLLFTTSKKAGTLEDDQFSEIADLLKKYISQENKEVKRCHEDINQSMIKVQENQDSLVSKLQKNFDKLQHNQQDTRSAIIKKLKSLN